MNYYSVIVLHCYCTALSSGVVQYLLVLHWIATYVLFSCYKL